MRVEELRTNLLCNQNCGFCHARDVRHDRVRFARQRLLAHIAALDEDLHAVVLTGGEPTLRADLEALIAAVADRRPGEVWLETNGMALAGSGRAAALREAGLHGVRVALPAWGAACDALTRVPGGFVLTTQGVRAALSAGLQVQAGVTLVAPSLADAGALPAQIAAHWTGTQGVWLRAVTAAPAPFVAPLEALARAAQAVAAGCARVGLGFRFDPSHALAPCLLTTTGALASLRAVPRAAGTATQRVAACRGCAMRDQCPGVPAEPCARFGVPEVRALDERAARRYRDAGGAASERVERHMRAEGIFAGADGKGGIERLLRPIFACNQDCTFCFVDRELPAPDPERIRQEIRQAADDGVGMLSLSGGEPTLDPHLLAHVRLAKSLGLRVRLQTNAVRLARGPLAAALAEAGLDDAFVSLHAPDAATSDALTRAPGTFEATLAGIDALLAAAIEVRLNCVITASNHRSLPGLVRLVAQRFGGRPILVLSWAHASTSLVPVSAEITPSWSEVRPSFTEAVAVAQALGQRWRGLDGQCGLPLCLPGRELLDLTALPPLPSADPPAGFIKVEACRGCALTLRCVGMRASHAHLHGTDELRAFATDDLPEFPA